ncbi:MAG: hypothetical protein EOP04_03065 [Proteobacteria bacterium]|nr:MAG: hypothetical protein EOP04_03065 [Pseudomonadota bacterium]
MNCSYKDRAIAEQTSKSSTLGLGARFNLTNPTTEGSGLKGIFLQFSYKMRTQVVEKQDDQRLSDSIIQKDGYPLFGIGVGF